MKTHQKLLVTAAVLSLGACATNDMSMTSEPFGQAVRHNIAMQTVEPTAEQKQNTYIRPDADRMALARERYKNDKVEKPDEVATQD